MNTNQSRHGQDEIPVSTIAKIGGLMLTVALSPKRKRLVVRPYRQLAGVPVQVADSMDINLEDLQGIVSGLTAALIEAQRLGLVDRHGR